MTLFPEITENGEKDVTLYFPVGDRNADELRREIESTYACCSSSGVVLKNGKRYVSIVIEDV